VAANILQVGFLLSAEGLVPDLNRLNPVSGFERMFNLRAFVTLLMSFAKLIIVVAVAYYTLRSAMPGAARLMLMDPGAIFMCGAQAVIELATRLAMVLFLLGLADFGYQYYQYNEDIRMTKQEVKEEHKDLEGDPQIRARRRQIQRQLAEVPQAEVVVRNPTHFSVALKYKPDMSAPKVVAKGADKLAMKINELAIKHGVPVWRQPALARQLFKVEIGEAVPPALFPAVAEVLAHVLRGEKRAEFMRQLNRADRPAAA